MRTALQVEMWASRRANRLSQRLEESVVSKEGGKAVFKDEVWEVKRMRNNWDHQHGDKKSHPMVEGWRCVRARYERNPAREEARARLFAAAPQLLEAGRALLCAIAVVPNITEHKQVMEAVANLHHVIQKGGDQEAM